MRILGIDFETTGLDTSKDRITEMGFALWDVPTKRPLVTVGVFLHDESYPPQSQEILGLTGISNEMLREFGTAPAANFSVLEGFCTKHKIEYIVAHNGENFDRPFLYAELSRVAVAAPVLRALPWIDTRTDIPFAKEPDSRKLNHLALDLGFINPFAHRAVFDVLTMLRILSNYAIEDVLAYQRIPFVVLRALVSYENREQAKKQRFAWEKIGEKTWPKCWVKKVKLNLLQAELDACKKQGFDAIQIE